MRRRGKAFITGGAGFVGSHLVEYLGRRGLDIAVLVPPGESLALLKRSRPKIKIVRGDIRDQDRLKRILKAAKPEYIFHLAAQSNVGLSWKDPAKTFSCNVLGTLALLEAYRQGAPRARFLYIGSAEEYGRSGKVFTENDPLCPVSPYAASKVAAEALCRQYSRSLGLPIICLRPFSHIGPRQSPVFAVSSFARQIAVLEKRAKRGEIWTGNLKVKRDFTDVRDIVRAYWLAARRGRAGEAYNICSGRAIGLAAALRQLVGLSRGRIKVKADPARFRRADLPQLLGSGRKFARATGWRPLVPLEKTLTDLLNYWRAEVGQV